MEKINIWEEEVSIWEEAMKEEINEIKQRVNYAMIFPAHYWANKIHSFLNSWITQEVVFIKSPRNVLPRDKQADVLYYQETEDNLRTALELFLDESRGYMLVDKDDIYGERAYSECRSGCQFQP